MTSKRKLLLVEDDSAVVGYVRIVFESAGYEVLSADTVESALALIDQHPDITEALVDGSLHVKGFCNTIPVVQRLKMMNLRRIVAISGSPDSQKQLCQAGCTEESPKPFKMPQLLALAESEVSST